MGWFNHQLLVGIVFRQCHTIHGTGIFTLHVVDFYGFHVGKYASPMDPQMGMQVVCSLFQFSKPIVVETTSFRSRRVLLQHMAPRWGESLVGEDFFVGNWKSCSNKDLFKDLPAVGFWSRSKGGGNSILIIYFYKTI